MQPQTARAFMFWFRISTATMFLNAASQQILNPKFTIVPVVSHARTLPEAFAIFATPTVAPAVGLFVAWGHLLIGLSLLIGLMVRVSAATGIALLLLYWLAATDISIIDAADHADTAAPVLNAYRVVKHVAEATFGDAHILYAVLLLYVIAGRGGEVWGLYASAAKLPFLARHRRLRALIG